MNFKLSLSTDNVTFSEVDLFPKQNLTYDAEFYDDKDLDNVKIPFITDIKIPLTDSNKSFFGYNPLSQNASNFPDVDYFYKIEVENVLSSVLYGVCKVDVIEYNSDEPYIEVSLKDFLSRFLSDLKDIKVGDILTQSHFTTRHEMNDFFNTTANGGEAGTLDTTPDLTRIVNFPYIDFVNDVERLGYQARQFTEYGSGLERRGLVPTLSVSQYLKQIGSYLSTTNIPVRVKSRLFGINETEALADFDADRLQMIIPANLQAKSNVNTRQFQLNQGPKWVGQNEDLESENDLDGNAKKVETHYFGNMETFGNYGSTGLSYQKYGIKALDNTAYVAQGEENELGYFCPHMTFNGKLQYQSGDRFETTGLIYYEIPVMDEDKMVYRILHNHADSTATFNLCMGIYEDGYLKKKLILRDSSGDPIVLSSSQATPVAGDSDKYTQTRTDFRRNANGLDAGVYIDNNTHPLSNRGDALRWPSQTVYLPSDQDLEMTFYGDSRYSVNYFVEPVEGDLRLIYANTFYQGGGTFGSTVWYVNAMTTSNFAVSKIRKAVTEIQSYSNLSLLAKANEDFTPYFPDDEYVIKDSINNTCDLTPVDLLKMICTRFGCGLFYEFDGTHHLLRIDPLHLLRTTTQSGDYMIDDLKSIKIYRPQDKPKNLVISNKSYGAFFDDINEDVTRGSTTQVLNADGIDDLQINLKSSVYYKAICGETFFDDNENLELGIINKFEFGATDNVFGTKENIGVRFAYLLAPNYPTNIKVPYCIEQSKRPNLTTTTQRIYRTMYTYPTLAEEDKHVFNGRLTHISPSGFNLMAEDNTGNTTDYYDLISDTEQVKSKSSVNVELSMVVPTNQVGDVMFMLKKTSFSLINGQNVLIKSASGDVYEENTYLDIKGIIE